MFVRSDDLEAPLYMLMVLIRCDTGIHERCSWDRRLPWVALKGYDQDEDDCSDSCSDEEGDAAVDDNDHAGGSGGGADFDAQRLSGQMSQNSKLRTDLSSWHAHSPGETGWPVLCAGLCLSRL